MPLIPRESGAEDRLLRPLCTENRTPTLPERKGWVKRDDLYDFSGRNRMPQISLAKEFCFEEYSQPAGACFLTDKSYSEKMWDLWKSRRNKSYNIDAIMLLKVARNLRPKTRYKLIVGREEGETIT